MAVANFGKSTDVSRQLTTPHVTPHTKAFASCVVACMCVGYAVCCLTHQWVAGNQPINLQTFLIGAGYGAFIGFFAWTTKLSPIKVGLSCIMLRLIRDIAVYWPILWHLDPNFGLLRILEGSVTFFVIGYFCSLTSNYFQHRVLSRQSA